MSEPTPIQREVESADAAVPGTTTIDHFGRSWTVPVKRHFRHVQAMRNHMVRGVGNWDLMIAEVFLDDRLFDGLPKGQLEALFDINPDDDELDGFTKKVASAIGLEAQGN
jgi:hypothetical protein